VAQSFIRTAADVVEVRAVIQNHRSTVPLIAKIETQDALTNIDEIIASVDGVVVARGDLGVAAPLATVPRLQ
jgi:pyruvate kinase